MNNLDFLIFISDKMFFAVLCGIIVGIERFFNDKKSLNTPSMKIMILVCVGSMIFTASSIYTDILNKETARIIGQIITGIGFLGAGVIIHKERKVEGLTTSAFIWFLASMGVLIGLDLGLSAVFITVTLTVVITLIQKIESYFIKK
jgi:putative Mg2+ transporter-C (MgtC) family protein